MEIIRRKGFSSRRTNLSQESTNFKIRQEEGRKQEAACTLCWRVALASPQQLEDLRRPERRLLADSRLWRRRHHPQPSRHCRQQHPPPSDISASHRQQRSHHHRSSCDQQHRLLLQNRRLQRSQGPSHRRLQDSRRNTSMST